MNEDKNSFNINENDTTFNNQLFGGNNSNNESLNSNSLNNKPINSSINGQYANSQPNNININNPSNIGSNNEITNNYNQATEFKTVNNSVSLENNNVDSLEYTNSKIKENGFINKVLSNKLGLIIGIVVIAIIIISIFIMVFSGNVSNNNIFDSKTKSITENDIKKYNLETSTVWINKPLNIIYNIPKKVSDDIFNGTSSFSYMHGSSFQYDNGYEIYVDKSLEGHKNLETLASDIIGEKKSDKYKLVYQFGSEFLKEFSNAKTEQVKIGNINTTYFESENIETSTAFGNELTVKIVGYSFKYKDEYISVYGELVVKQDSKLELLKQFEQYVINSIKQYNGESLQELDGNVKEYYDDGFTNDFSSRSSQPRIAVNNYSDHIHNGILGGRSDFQAFDRFCTDLSKDYIKSWNDKYDGILNSTLDSKYSESKFEWVNTAYNISNKKYTTLYDIVKESNVKINNINMKKYILKVYHNVGKTAGKYVVVYTFTISNQPFLCQYRLGNSIYESKKLGELSNGEQQIIIEQTEAVSDALILTLRTLNQDEKYSKYIELF